MTTPTIGAAAVKQLRDLTGAGFMDCKHALEETGGDIERAVALLSERNQASAAMKAGREAREGLIYSYVHTGGRIGSLIEVNCETDFVARTDQFQRLVRDLAMQVVALHPLYTTVEAIPAQALEARRTEILADESVARKPLAIREQIVDGQLKKWYQQVVLHEQPFRDTELTVGQLIVQSIATIGEAIRVRRFVRFELGEES
ncbi:MAG: translation elongation factor Ts [Candidatus Limnocylindrales bacterium]